MRLGIVGMLPGDFRTHESSHFETIRELAFTGAGFHFPGEEAAGVDAGDVDEARKRFETFEIDLVQMAVTYRECLFDRDAAVRKTVVEKIKGTAALARDMRASYFLIRPGSLNPAGSWTPHKDNQLPGSWDRLIETLGEVVKGLEGLGVTAVMETHLVSILKNPETCRAMVEALGSDRMRLVMDYVNHFETLGQVYANEDRLDHIFAEMGPLGPVMHVKDISVGNGLVLHINEDIPGNGELNLQHCFRLFEAQHPDEYGLIEHLGMEDIPEATRNTRRIAKEAGVTIY